MSTLKRKFAYLFSPTLALTIWSAGAAAVFFASNSDSYGATLPPFLIQGALTSGNQQEVVSNSPGTYTLNNSTGLSQAIVVLTPFPQINLVALGPDNQAFASLSYSLEVLTSSSILTVPILVTASGGILTLPGTASSQMTASAGLTVAAGGSPPVVSGSVFTNSVPFTDNFDVSGLYTLLTNTVYTVTLSAEALAHQPQLVGMPESSAFVDPMFQIDGALVDPSLFDLELSPGVGNSAATPIPGAFLLFATGLGALGLLGWRRKRKV